MSYTASTIISTLEQFLKKQLCSNAPILLAFSGGPDSLALLHALLQLKATFKIDLHLAHVDHKWRNESTQEALQLQKMAASLGLPFHLKTLFPENLKGNLEAASRQERLQFFAELTQKHAFQGVLMAHHADDQAETVLKRIFEGTTMPYLSSLSPVKELMGMSIWRPFLTLKKSEILDYLKNNELNPILDHTNLDPAYMRGRMRTTILPQLSEVFGKEITQSLCRLAEESQDLRTTLDQVLQPYLLSCLKGPLGLCADLSSHTLSLFELKYFIRKLCEMQNFTLVRPLIDKIAEFIVVGASDKQLNIKDWIIHIDRKKLFFVKEGNTPVWNYEILTTGTEPMVCDWKEVWQGKSEIILPPGNYRLGQLPLSASYKGSVSLGKWWTDHKVPAFLRRIVPVILRGESVQHEFLTGKTKEKIEHTSGLLIRLNLKVKQAVC